MTLLDDLNKVSATKYQCAAGVMLKSMPPKEAAAILEVLDNPETSATLLSRVLEKHGYTISRKTLTRHRLRGHKTNGCVCK